MGSDDTRISLRDLVAHASAVQAGQSLEEVHKEFATHPQEFMAVLEGRRAIGVCSRQQVGILLGHRFGFSVFSRDPVSRHLMPEPLIFPADMPIHDALRKAFAREDERMYQDVLLVDGEIFVGLIHAHALVRLQTKFLIDSVGELLAKQKEIYAKNRQMEEDLLMARQVQRAVLPAETCELLPGAAIGISRRYLPAGVVGGDFYYYLRVSDSVVAAVLCDVMGHGVQAALITAMLRALVEDLGAVAGDPGPALERINAGIYRILRGADVDMFVTACCAAFDTAKREMRYAIAGHPTPFMVRRGTRQVHPLPVPRGTHGPALGLFEGAHYASSRQPIEAGDLLLMYTDGLCEQPDKHGGEFGIDGLAQAIKRAAKLPTGALLDSVLHDVIDFASGADFADDVCLLALEWL